jgi:hypothetical protein
MPRYHIHFAATRDHYPQSSEHTRVIDLENPIEYDSDIQLVQDLAAEHVGAKSAMLTSWRELKGALRPDYYHCLPCRMEWPVGYEVRCTVCSRLASAGPLFEKAGA